MSENNEVTVYDVPKPLTVSDMKAQVNLIQEVMQSVMKKDEHYGVIPGTGNKPSLLKAGAEKLIMTFRLVPDIEEQTVEYDGGHREIRVKVKMYAQNGVYLGSGVGSCSTMEGKYRYRTGPVEFTGKPVPKEYWDMRKENPSKALELIGGKGHSTKKNDAGVWEIVVQGEKMEHDNPADYYNTVLKMAKKRALVDACLTVTAASDIFTQDIEDMPEVIPGAATATNATAKPKPPTPKPKKEATPQSTENPAELTVEGLILEVSIKEGERSGKPWVKWGVKLDDGNWYGTFDKKFGGVAEGARDFNLPVRIGYKVDGKFNTLTSIETISEDFNIEPEEEREPGEDG